MCRPNADSRRKPTHSEGRRVARGLLAGVQDTSVLDLGYDSSAVASVPAYQWLFSGAGYSTNSAQLERDVHLQIVVETLRRVRVSPRGKSVSGCRIVAEALDLSEDAVTHIWKQRGWAESYEPMLRKHLDAVSERPGLVYANDT